VFRSERAAVTDAANTAKRSINTTLVVSALALIVAAIAIVVALFR
jgi:hypothetical protein